MGWNGGNWCDASYLKPEAIQQHLLFRGFWMGLGLGIFTIAVLIASYNLGRDLDKKIRLTIVLAVSLLFLISGCVIANTENNLLLRTINDANLCKD